MEIHLLSDASSLGWGSVPGKKKGDGQSPGTPGQMEHVAYQLFGDDGGMAHIETLRATIEWQGCHSPL